MGRMGASGKSDRKIIDMIYPVGSVYISVNNVSPQSLFGGSWEQLKDRFMLGAGDTYTAGAMGGEANVALSQDNIPRMTTSSANKSYATTRVMGQAGSGTNTTSTRSAAAEAPTGGASWEFVNISWNSNHSHTVGGNGTAHNNMPPYLVVYIWKRTA